MKRLIFLVITLMFLQQARAQFSGSFAPATMCPWPMQPASGAYHEDDEEDRQKKYERDLKRRVKEQQSKLEKIDRELEELQGNIDRRLQPEISSKVVEHIQLGGNPGDYHRDCAAQTAASAGSTASNVPLPNGDVAPANPNGTGQSETASLPVDRFCEGPLAAAWSRNIQANGRVNPGICRESSQLVVRPGSSSSASACSDALNRYMSLYERRNEQERRLAEAREDLDDFEFGDVDSDIEGDCIGCKKRGNGMSTASGNQWMNLLGTVIQVGVPALQNYLTNKQWQKTYRAAHTYEVDNCSRLGYPSQFCYGQYSLAQRWLGHAQRPYPSPMPGYFGSYNGMYGAVPGGIGSGAFGCNPGGYNPMGMPTLGGIPIHGTNMGGLNMPGTAPYMGGQGPWGGTYIPQQPGSPWSGFNGMPPGAIPIQSGSPGYNPYLLNSELNLINSRMGLGPPPPTLPYLGSPTFHGGPMPLPAPVTPSPSYPYGLGSGVINGR